MARRTLVMDFSVLAADLKIRDSLLAGRTAVSDDNCIIDTATFTLDAGESYAVPNLPASKAFFLYANYPVNVTGTIAGNVNPTNWTSQSMVAMTSGVQTVTVTNVGTKVATVTVIRLSSIATIGTTIARHLITFSPLSRIAPIGATVTNLANVVVEDVALFQLTNDQVSAPSSTAGPKFRVCDPDGTANPTGTHIMYLDDIVTQQNFAGTLQLWVEEN